MGREMFASNIQLFGKLLTLDFCVTAYVVPETSREHVTFIFKRSRISWWTLNPWRTQHQPLTQWCSLISQCTRNTDCTFMKTSKLANCLQLWKPHHQHSLATKAQLLSFNSTKSRVVTGLLTRHNTLSRHLYVMGFSSNPTCRKCGTCLSVRAWPYSDMH